MPLILSVLACHFYQNTVPEEEGGQPNHEDLSKQDDKVSHLGVISWISPQGYHQFRSKHSPG